MNFEVLDTTLIVLDPYDGLKEMTVRDFVREFYPDETTTPNGVAPRLHTRERVYDTGESAWEIWEWGPGQSEYILRMDAFSTQEQAEETITMIMYERYCRRFSTNVLTFSDWEEAAKYYYDQYVEVCNGNVLFYTHTTKDGDNHD
jgi:hypothetical protein